MGCCGCGELVVEWRDGTCTVARIGTKNIQCIERDLQKRPTRVSSIFDRGLTYFTSNTEHSIYRKRPAKETHTCGISHVWVSFAGLFLYIECSLFDVKYVSPLSNETCMYEKRRTKRPADMMWVARASRKSSCFLAEETYLVEKKPIKETYMYEKRPVCMKDMIWVVRALVFCQQILTYLKRTLQMRPTCMKRDLYVCKQTCRNEKRPVCMQTDL